eukprot:1060590-Ditylum_brightwellii.AAC.1
MEYSMRIYAANVAKRGINGIVERIVTLKKMTTPTDIGNTVKFLCLESGMFLTGTVLPIDGGFHLKR